MNIINRFYRRLISRFLLLIILSSCSFSAKTSRRFFDDAKKNGGYEIVVVPGVPFINRPWSNIMKARVYWSKYLIDEGITKNVMYSGSAVYSPYVEAEIMAMYAKKIGIPADNIYVEDKAEHSTENMYYSYKKAKKLGFKSIALATDPFQSKMIRKFTQRKVSPNVGFLPILFDTLASMQSKMNDPPIDFESACRENFLSLTERENFRQRFRGTMGQAIDTLSYQ